VTTVPSWPEVGASLVLVALVALISLRQRLHITRDLIIASARAGVQLAAVGAVLMVLFARAGLPGALGWIAFMIALAGQIAGRRGRGLPRSQWIATVSVTGGTVVTMGTLVALGVISTQSRVLIPIGGMVVSGAMLSTGMVMRRLLEEADTARPAIEARLSLGMPARQAFLPHQRSALRTALIPGIDSTKVVGLISLPGAMTGLIMAGVDPLTAIRYQIVVMYMMLAATALAALIATRLAERTLFDDAHRLLDARRNEG
jgi:putative ABC transport system permease protein